MMYWFLKKRKLAAHYPEVAGVMSRRWAFRGPRRVELHLTNRCNYSCLPCWTHSPFVEDEFREYVQQELPFHVVERLIRDLARLGTEMVSISGGGEPFCYPRIWDVIELLQKKGIKCALNTNLSLLQVEDVITLIEKKVHTLIVSLWAATEDTYNALHCGASKGTFERILSVIEQILFLRRDRGIDYPGIDIFNVVCARNYHEVARMLELAVRLGVDVCTLTPIDPIKGKTEHLLLNQEQRKELVGVVRSWLEQRDQDNLDGTSLRWAHDFLRRIESVGALHGQYDDAVSHRPCFAGWSFAEVEASGNVSSCCKSTQYPVGNLNNTSFERIWNGRKQQAFRQKVNWDGSGQQRFPGLSCDKLCDNLDDIRYIESCLQRYNAHE